MMAEEVLLVSLVVRGSHIIAEQVHLANAEVPRQIDQLEATVAAEVNSIRSFA